MLQSTKPQTLAYGLNDSPVGLAAWIAEKFKTRIKKNIVRKLKLQITIDGYVAGTNGELIG